MRTHQLFLLSSALVTACQALASERNEPSPSLPQLRQASAAFDGRVFFSAIERRALETKPTATAPAIPIPISVAPPLPKRRFDGTLWRDGRIVALWFDGDSVDPNTEPAIRIGDGIPGTVVSGRRQTLSPGQNWPLQDRKSEP